MAEVDRQTEEALGATTMLPSADWEEQDPPKPEVDRFGDTIAEYVEPALSRAVERLRDAGVTEVDEDDPRLYQALRRANDYAGDMAMAGVEVGEAAWGAVAGAVGEVFGGSPEGERRLARDIMAMPEAFAGTGFTRGANQLDDILGGASSLAARGVRGLERLGEGAAEAYREGRVGSNLGNVGKTDAPFDAERGAGVVVRKTGFSGGDSGPSMEDVLGARAQEMSRKPKDRIQPSGEQTLFDLSPESYERTLPEQRETYVPRLPEGSNRTLPKGDRGRPVQEMSDQIADRLAERMEPFVGTEAQYFYHTGPIIDKARDLGFSDEEIYSWMRDFADAYAATSPRTETAQNIRNATLALAKRQLNVDLDEVVGPGGDGINEKGYPMMIGEDGPHRRLLELTQNGGIDPDTNPKPATFAENVYGNLDGVTVDTHAIRGALDAMNEVAPGSIPEGYIKPKFREQYRSDPSTFDPARMVDDKLGTQKVDGKSRQTEYAVFSDIYRKAAESLGVSPAEAQSMGWFGSGDRTGLASEVKSVARLLEDRIDVTAQATGTDKETIFRRLLNREIPVMSIMPAAPAAGLMTSDDESRDGFARGGLALSESRKGIKTQAGRDMAGKRHQLDRKKADTDGDGTVSEYEKQKAEAVQRAEQKDEIPDMACGGIMMDPMMQGVDPVSGNPIPLGSTAENVRDDIPTRLSSDEYVLPAHVVKYHGLKHIMSLQEEAELGLMAMDAAGLIPSSADGDEESDSESPEDAEVSGESGDPEEGQEGEETLETPEGNEIEVAGVETTTKEFEDDETEEYEESAYPTKSSMFGMMKKPKVTFIV